MFCVSVNDFSAAGLEAQSSAPALQFDGSEFFLSTSLVLTGSDDALLLGIADWDTLVDLASHDGQLAFAIVPKGQVVSFQGSRRTQYRRG